MKKDNKEMEVNAIRKFCRYLCHKYLDLLKLDAALFDAPVNWGHGEQLPNFDISPCYTDLGPNKQLTIMYGIGDDLEI